MILENEIGLFVSQCENVSVNFARSLTGNAEKRVMKVDMEL